MGGEPKKLSPFGMSDIIILKRKVTTMEDLNTISDSVTQDKPVAKKTAAKKTAAKKTTATKKAAEKAPVEVNDVSIEEASEPEISDKVIKGPANTSAPRNSNTNNNADGVFVSNAADSALRRKTDTTVEEPKKSEDDKVALWSARNLRWTSVGSLSTGYNIVTKEAAEKWLGRQGVRKASPEEVSTYYGK